MPQTQDVHELFEAHATQTPDAVALVNAECELTYGELNVRANRLAYTLRAKGVGPETRVALCVERSVEMVVGIYGIWKAGAAYVPIEPDYPRERIATMLADSAPLVVLSQTDVVGRLPAHTIHTICLDDEAQWRGATRDDNFESGVRPEHPAYIVYTSGSTGRPKGVVNTHGSLSNLIEWMQATFRLTPGERVLQNTPFIFDVSLVEFCWPLCVGATLVIGTPHGHKDSAYLVRVIAAQRITTVQFVPSMLQVFLEEPGLGGLSSLRRVLCAGEALPAWLQARFYERVGAELHNLYGPTETAVYATHWPCAPQSVAQTVPIGKPVANTYAYVLDDDLQQAPDGQSGELYLGGAALARGYLAQPGLTAERFIPDPWAREPGARLYRTGDQARYLPDGRLEFVGRLDQQIKLHGIRIELGEIESALMEHPAVRAAAVTAREEQPGEKRLSAYIVPREAGCTPQEVRSYLQRRLPEYMIPGRFVFLDALPLTASGKLDRAALPAVASAVTPETDDASGLPEDDIERKLVGLWEEVLGVRPIGTHDDFFEQGGHSLSAIRMFQELERRLGTRYAPELLYRAPTIHELAAQMRCAQPTGQEKIVVAMQPAGNRQPLWLANGLNGSVLGYTALVRGLGAEQPVFGLQATGLAGERESRNLRLIAARFIEAMRSVQRDGPYQLAGYCFGGIVAFEMACQLRAQNQPVALLAILEGYALPLIPGKRALSMLRYAQWFAGNVPRWLDEFATYGYGPMSRRLRRITRRLALDVRYPHGIPPTLPEEDAALSEPVTDPVLRVIQDHITAHDRYLAGHYDGEISLFRTMPENRLLPTVYDATLGWGALAAGVKLFFVPGVHGNMLEPPHVHDLAEQLTQCLANATRAARPEARTSEARART